jgi:tetratricopeptide (TPR) repeat protein
MVLTALEYKNQGNQYYSNNDSLSAIESYSEAITLIKTNPDENLPLYLLYLNRSAAYIQDKNYYSGYEDAKESLLIKKDENLKGFYRAAICAYHLGFIDESEKFIKEATNNHHENLLDYLDLKLLIEKKVNSMKKYQKSMITAKKSLKNLEEIIQKQDSLIDLPSILYHIRYLLRAFFENKEDKKQVTLVCGLA